MFSNNIKSFIILTIYILIIIDLGLLCAIYYQIIKDRIQTRKYKKTYTEFKPRVITCLEDEGKFFEVNRLLKSNFTKELVIDIMINYSENKHLDLSNKFIQLNLDTYLIKKILKRVDIVYLRKLAYMRVATAYDTLLKLAITEDLDISYMCFFALSMIELPELKKEIVINKLVASNILSDRIVEILNKYNLRFEEWMKLLEKEQTKKGKVVFIKNIMLKEEIKLEKNSNRLQKFLSDEKEVKIAAIDALCSTKNEKYINNLITIYDIEEDWTVRVAVAKGFRFFKLDSVKNVLLKMTKDKEWWVRYDAIKSIVAMGDEGLFTLVDLSLEVDDKNVADLAYYFLNSNKDVYNTVMSMGEVQTTDNDINAPVEPVTKLISV